MKRFFFGGIHPRYNKEMSINKEELLTVSPKQVVIPLQQHIGNPCKPLVKVGDYVLKGQKIGDGDGMCVPVHSSVSGAVSAIEPRLHPNGQVIMSIVIDNNFKNATVNYDSCDLSIEQLDADNVLHAIREAGIVGMGGAAFPSNIKAFSALGNIDTLIANACECEPYITSDDTLLRTNPKQVLEGMMILNRVLTPNKIVLAIEENKAVAIEKLRALKQEYPLIEISVLPTRYPQGSEKQLIQSVTGRQVPPGGLPFDVNSVVFNVSTFAAIYKAVRMGMPLIDRIVTVTGEGVSNPQNFNVPIGTCFADLIDMAGGLKEKAERVLNGGPMMGIAQGDLSVPVVKATNCVLCLCEDKNSNVENPVCIRCGKCVSACPMHLKPLYIYRFASLENRDELNRLNVTDCIECGCCSFTCPGKLALTDSCRKGKILVKEAAGNES